MANKRDSIRMSDEEIRTFIENGKDLQVATINKDGMPHLSTLWYATDDQGRICFETYEKSQKVVNLRRDPRISVLLCSGTTYNELKGVVIYGRAELHSEPDEVYPHALAVLRKNNPEIPAEMLEPAARHMAAKRSSVAVIPERIVSWDHTKLTGGGLG